MPNFTFSSPDGKSYTVSGPDGATPEQAFGILQKQISAPTQPQGNAFSDVIPEIKNAASENIAAIKGGLLNNPQKSAIGGLLDTGRGLLGIPGLLASPITGAARSLLGHPLADATHAIGGVINPAVAAQDNPQQMYEHAKEGVDTAMMGIAPRGASPTGLRTIAIPPPSGPALRMDAADTYNSPAIKSIPIAPADVATLSQRIENDLLTRGFRPTNGSAPGTLAEVQRMVPDPAVAAVNVDDIRGARRALNMTAKQRDPINQPTPDATAASAAIRHIDAFLDNVSPELRQANANYSAGKLDQTLDYRNMQAQHRAAKTGSGSNIENTMRQEVDKIKNIGLRPAEITARNQIVEGTVVRNALRKVGKLGFGDGVSMMYHAGLALPTGGANLPVGVAATAARKLGEALTRREIAALSNQIRSRSPTAQALALHTAPMQIPNRARAIAATLLGQNVGFMPAGLVPAHAKENQ